MVCLISFSSHCANRMKAVARHIILIPFLLTAAWARLTAQDLSVFVADQRIACSDTVDVPVQASRFRGMLTMQGGIGWDTSRLRQDLETSSTSGLCLLGIEDAKVVRWTRFLRAR